VLWNLAFTSRFDGFVVGLADELLVVHEIELVSGVQLPTAHGAGETLQVIDVVLRSPDDLCRRDSLFAAGTLCAVTTTTPHTPDIIYTVSHKTSHLWLAITLTHVNGF